MDNHNELEHSVTRLVDLVSRLRGPGGCPWDAKQTEDTVRMYLLEEAHEVVEAVESEDWSELCGELGDLLFQIVFLSKLAEEKGAFSLKDVVEGITEKMVRRHPHVFGSARADTPEEVSENWQRIKQKERGGDKAHAGGLSPVPEGLPSLLRAHRLNRRAMEERGVSGDPDGKLCDIENGLKLLKATLGERNREDLRERIGWLLFDVAGFACRCGLNAEDILRITNRRFERPTAS